MRKLGQMNGAKDKLHPDRLRVLVVSDGDAGGNASRPHGWRLAEAFSRDFDVVLATSAISQASHRSFAVVYYNKRNLGLMAHDSDFVVLAPATVGRYQFFAKTGKLEPLARSRLAARSLPDTVEAGSGNVWRKELQVWVPPRLRKGPVYYFKRLRYHLETGGPRQVLSRGRTFIGARAGRRRRGA